VGCVSNTYLQDRSLATLNKTSNQIRLYQHPGKLNRLMGLGLPSGEMRNAPPWKLSTSKAFPS